MDKYLTSLLFQEDLNIKPYGRILLEPSKSRYRFNLHDSPLHYEKKEQWQYYDSLQSLWEIIEYYLIKSEGGVFIKPNGDGSSVNIENIENFEDFHQYMAKNSNIDLILVEQYIETVSENKVIKKSGKEHFIEMTVGVLGEYIFTPSMTIMGGKYLSTEEKFEYGLGVNLTPPPKALVMPNTVNNIRERLKLFMKKLQVNSYCRVDFFFSLETQTIHIIEINSLPSLSPSTVLFQQAGGDNISQQELLELIIIHDLIEKS
jgi:D-alanine-D-alanine ligase-like ATP-grasp enzyme